MTQQPPFGFYDPRDEHDACGVGLVAAIDGTPRREVVTRAVAALKAVWHRGAVASDGKTGDGAGLRIDVAQNFFREQVERSGHSAKDLDVCVGMIFLPRTDFAAQDRARAIVETHILNFGFRLFGWRQAPVEPGVIGAKANAARPEIEQILFFDPKGRDADELERTLYIVRRRIEKQALTERLPDFYVCSLSPRDIIYKGMFLAGDIDSFYLDLQDDRFVSSFAIFHQRYSTNTFPEWRLAQPFRMLAHNGEINTVRGNIAWMKAHEAKMAGAAFGDYGEDIKPVIQPASSDSAALDAAFELLVRAGRSAPMAKALLVPEAWSKRESVLGPEIRALYEYCNAVMEPWDGPAALCAFDGRWAIAGLDRNGLRPLRYARTTDGLLAVGSESGMCPLDGKEVIERGAVPAGGMICADLKEGKFYGIQESLDRLVEAHPYTDWLKEVTDLDPLIGPGPEDRLFDSETLNRRQLAAGYSQEDLELILKPMVMEAKEAIGSMGDDTPLAVLSSQYRPLSHFFRQRFSQVTNPPIDPLREGRVMSLKTRFKNLGNILAQDETQSDVYVLEGPILTNGMYDRLCERLDPVVIDCTYTEAKGDGRALSACVDRIRKEACDAVRSGASHIVLSDENQGPSRLPLPMILAAGGVHRRLIDEGLRSDCSFTVRSSEAIDSHYAAVLIGVGATCVSPYLAFETIADRLEAGKYRNVTLSEAVLAYKTAIENGLLKILSKMGVSVLSAYRGGCNFETLGLSRPLIAEFFPDASSRISGMGFVGLEQSMMRLHDSAWPREDEGSVKRLPVGSFYRVRTGGEAHAYEASSIKDLQIAVRENDQDAYRRFSTHLQKQSPIQLRDLLDFTKSGKPIPLESVESVNSIRQRFVTPGMSLGALSPEAHGVLNVAMNRIGAKSVSGEGGEDPKRYTPMPNGDNMNSAVKQVASGRFGVTAEYLNQCREIEIKVAQGAKPGEGGQLPGFKVNAYIASLRHSTEGVTLISPPPHHDIYSIEDLAQLIYDLKQIAPKARVCVKLVSSAGVGTIAAGVAKAKADAILISGNVGGTGASPQTSIKFAGSPWELGLAEANQILTLNDLREDVTLRTDGGLRTGRDIVIAAMLGAEEYGIGTLSLVAMGCLMVRQCHSNTCPVGVCTQDEALRKKFVGTADQVVNLMTFIADEVREILASLGVACLDDIIGRTDLLAQVGRGSPLLDDLDLNPLLVRATGGVPPRSDRTKRNEVAPTLDENIVKDAGAVWERREKMQLTYTVRNTHRAVGTRTSHHIVKHFGELPDGHLTVRLRGSAGQSLGAFGAKGLRIEVEGDSNDYVGKGLSGAHIVVRGFKDEPSGSVLIGNTCLYGATDGRLFVAGKAGERFAVRNSGAVAVVEGVGSNGCEYMTGGTVVILGEIGDNFAAGMTGGKAFVYDEHDLFVGRTNPEHVTWRALGDHEKACRTLIEQHLLETGSPKARDLLSNWDQVMPKFRFVLPKSLADKLDHQEVSAVSA
ncbi:glutamate synthase, large subunit [Parvularcula bermudensis HTCC2503]|uniref:Glutamate synthase, large subunit n=1 Tax=Parvularcula bermudensis (strain ATCC BAA-594 / HTCC2503 / KCTC 12087) TaxID=314260 RepID=E0TCV7_PARBH|nr:glutamate synthase large subunit [Parvularcula bermudensis]ADM10340.1 glutamate synthase, large subunit [Parvularcula bermudensis HTCC2503]